jgi:hypothetical protein
MLTGGGGGGGGDGDLGAALRGPVGANPQGPVAAAPARAPDASGTSRAKSPVCMHAICQR